MQMAKTAGLPPRDIAEQVKAAIEAAPPPHLERVDVAGPGFLNFFLSPSWLHDVLREVVTAGDSLRAGRLATRPEDQPRVRLAEPHRAPPRRRRARGLPSATPSPTCSSPRARTCTAEYYLNDAGEQLGHVRELAATPGTGARSRLRTAIAASTSSRWPRACEPSSATTFRSSRRASGVTRRRCARGLREDLERIGVHFDTWFSERTLHERGDVDEVLRLLGERGYTYEQDGAVWLRTSELGDQRDRVLVRSDGEPDVPLPTTSRTTATSSPAGGSTSSTSGAPTTTAR